MSESGSDSTGYVPNFELPNHGVIREDNWQEYAAKGFVAVPEPFEIARILYGVSNVYKGDGYDYAEGRPLRHIPDSSAYTNQTGLDYLETQLREAEWIIALYELAHLHDGDDPAAS